MNPSVWEEVKSLTEKYFNFGGVRMGFRYAGIRDKREAAQRLINGEVFYCGFRPRKIYFDEGFTFSPFRQEDHELVTDWDCVQFWLVLESK